MKIPVGELMRCMGLMITGAENSTPYLKYLNIKKLDFTVDSLKYIDEYLLKIRKIKKKLNNDEILLIIVRCGTYLGEVVRKPNPKKFSWMTYESACKVGGKFIKSLGKNIQNCYVLYDGKTFYFPLSKPWKFIDEGSSQSLWGFAKVALDKNLNY